VAFFLVIGSTRFVTPLLTIYHYRIRSYQQIRKGFWSTLILIRHDLGLMGHRCRNGCGTSIGRHNSILSGTTTVSNTVNTYVLQVARLQPGEFLPIQKVWVLCRQQNGRLRLHATPTRMVRLFTSSMDGDGTILSLSLKAGMVNSGCQNLPGANTPS